MAKVEIKETSIQPAAGPVPAKRIEVTDARGRVILLRKPPVLAQFRFVEALGPSADSQAYLAMTMPLIFVGAIDGTPVVPPTTKGEVEAMIQRLDEDGLEAIMKGVQQLGGGDDPEEAGNGYAA